MPDKNNETEPAAVDPLERRRQELLEAKQGTTAKDGSPLSAPDLPQAGLAEPGLRGHADRQTWSPDTAEPAASAAVTADRDTRAEGIAAGADINDTAVDPLVDDIVSRESDELLKARDCEIAQAFATEKPGAKERLLNLLHAWWDNKPLRYGSLSLLLISVVAVGTVPTSRYFVLNSAGVRATASLTILDSTNNQPLKNVVVSVPGRQARTNQDGVVRLQGLKLGPQTLTVKRLGFAEISRTVTFGLGSNPLGDIGLRAVGSQFRFQLTDYLSGKPVKNAEISYGDDVTAQSDDKGQVVLTVGKLPEKALSLKVTAGGYRGETISLAPTATETTNLLMVVDRKQVYVSKQSGKYDLYKIDVDGRNKQLLLAGTGIENERLALVADPTGKRAAYVSTRENKRNQDGYLLQTLTLIDITDGSVLTLEHSERVQLVGWVQDRLVYVRVKAGTSAGNPERHQLITYSTANDNRLQLAAANYFSDVMIARGKVYYATTNNNPGSQSQFVAVGADNSGKQVLATEPIWNIARTGYDDLALNAGQQWYAYRFGEVTARKLATPPGNYEETRFYLDVSEGGLSL
ncbi:MAG TPA: hypothetical protein VK978_03180, partial [Candidatus Saccharimonadales bacterium]|nr:hypothetical protein [Candidatus Saccharimonadales bacterium]